MKTVIVILSVALTGCANGPWLLATIYDNNDPCQLQNLKGATMNEKVANMPSFCGSSGKRQYIYSTPNNQAAGNPIGYVQTIR